MEFLVVLLIIIIFCLRWYYRSRKYYIATILVATRGYDIFNIYHYYFVVEYAKEIKNGKLLKNKRIEVTEEVYNFYKPSDKILIKS